VKRIEQRQGGDPAMAGCGFSVVEKTHPSIVFTGKENKSFEHVLMLTHLLHTDKNEIQTPLLPYASSNLL